ncbi:MAG: hypothetical protein ACREDH_13515 [Methylocella sp.]
MPLSQAEKDVLVADAQKITTDVAALTVDPDPNPLQVALDAANAMIAQLQGKIDAAKTALA